MDVEQGEANLIGGKRRRLQQGKWRERAGPGVEQFDGLAGESVLHLANRLIDASDEGGGTGNIQDAGPGVIRTDRRAVG